MRALILALAAVSASAQSEFMTGEALQKEVAKLCDHGCIVFSPAEVEALQQAIVRQMAADLERAYREGKAASDLVCRNKTAHRF